MSKWMKNLKRAGFIVVPINSFSCGKKFHSICCSSSGLLFELDIVEGKDYPSESTSKEHYHKGKNVGLYIFLT